MSFWELVVELLQAAAIMYLSRGIRANSETIARLRKEIYEHRWL